MRYGVVQWLKTYWIWLIIIGTIGVFVPLTGKSDKKMLWQQNLDVLTETINLLQKQSLEPSNQHVMIHAAISGMLSALDPHSMYLDEDEFRNTKNRDRGFVFGTGINIIQYLDELIVSSTIKGSPSEKAGIQPGDVIKEIDGKPTIGWTSENALKYIDGTKNKAVKVNLAIERTGIPNLIYFNILRSEILPSNIYNIMLTKTIGLIFIKDFNETTPNEFERAVYNLKNQGMRSLILDLRNNPGGRVDAALSICNQLFNPNELIFTQKGRSHDNVVRKCDPKNYNNNELPIVVIINHHSASSSEIVAGSIQDHDRGLIVGQTSWGKGLVQEEIAINRTQGLALTTARYYTPSGRCVQRNYKNCVDDYHLDNYNEKLIQHQGPKFKTDLGRTVYGNEGIVPDYVVGNDKPAILANNISDQINNSYFFKFALIEKERHSIKPQQSVDDKTVKRFKIWLKQQKVAINEADWNDFKIKTNIQNLLSSNIQNIIYGSEAQFKFQYTYDPQVKMALAVMPKAELLLKQRMNALKKYTSSLQITNQQQKCSVFK